jgi:acyl-coenzyme A thioesterase PaaI-like protein
MSPADELLALRHELAPAPGELIPSHFAHCFGCGDLHPFGLHVKAFAGSEMDLTASFVVTQDHQGAPGLAHGGLLSLAFDEAHGKLLWLLRQAAVTAHLETDFKLPVPVGSTLVIKAWIERVEGRKVYTKAVGYLNEIDGAVAVTSSSLYVIVPMSHFLENAPKEFLEYITNSPHLHNSVVPDFEVNP